jgi:hypothetical protein
VYRRRRALPPLVLAALAAAGPVPAQTAADPAQRLEATERRLQARLDTLLSRMEAIPPTRRGGPTDPRPVDLDTVMVGGLRLVAPAGDMATVEPWVRDVVAEVVARLGPLPALEHPPTIRVDWRPLEVRYSPDWIRVVGLSAGEVRRTLENAVSQALTGPLGTAAAPYEELAASRAAAVRGCTGGDALACETALGLAPPAPAALSPEARRSFLHHLLRTRADAFDRLAADPGSRNLRAALEAAAGTPLGPIVAEWRDAVLARRPTALPASVVGTTLVWILLFVALATRSTRWRAG